MGSFSCLVTVKLPAGVFPLQVYLIFKGCLQNEITFIKNLEFNTSIKLSDFSCPKKKENYDGFTFASILWYPLCRNNKNPYHYFSSSVIFNVSDKKKNKDGFSVASRFSGGL